MRDCIACQRAIKFSTVCKGPMSVQKEPDDRTNTIGRRDPDTRVNSAGRNEEVENVQTDVTTDANDTVTE